MSSDTTEQALADFNRAMRTAVNELVERVTASVISRTVVVLRPKAKRGRKRKPIPDTHQQATDRVIDYIGKHPGITIVALNARLGTLTSQVRQGLKDAIATGRITFSGDRRSRKYYPGKEKRS